MGKKVACETYIIQITYNKLSTFNPPIIESELVLWLDAPIYWNKSCIFCF